MVESTKPRLRSQLRSARQHLSDALVKQNSFSITKRIIEFMDWKGVKSVHCYAASTLRNEPDTTALLGYIWKNHPHIETFVPVARGPRMVSVKVDSLTQWQPGQYGFPEPVSGKTSSKGERYDVVVVPLLGFNEQGYRIGYGGGYYDRFLATQPQTKAIGLCYEDGLVSFVPESHDLSLEVIVTERTIRKWKNKL